jgi:hypothetical protein
MEYLMKLLMDPINTWTLFQVITEFNMKGKQMGNKKEKVSGQALVRLVQTKESFYKLCEQYEHMGKLLKLQAKTMKHPIFKPTSAPACLMRMIEQHDQFGEQLKEIGMGLDAMGGKPVLEAEEKMVVVDIEEEVLEKTIKDMKDTHKNTKFVSNIPSDDELGKTKEGDE